MRNKSGKDTLQQAKEYAFLLLKFRQRTEKELTFRLLKKGFDEAISRAVVVFLKEKGFVDDASFCRDWIESRLKKPLGLRRLAVELQAKGIDKRTIEAQLSQAKNGYSEQTVVAALIRKKQPTVRGLDPQKAQQRMYAYLVRRGFSPDVIVECLQEIKEFRSQRETD